MYIALLLRLLLCLCAVRSKKVYDFSGQKGHRGYVDDPREDADLVSGYPSNPVEDEFLVARITPHVMPKAPRKNALVTLSTRYVATRNCNKLLFIYHHR